MRARERERDEWLSEGEHFWQRGQPCKGPEAGACSVCSWSSKEAGRMDRSEGGGRREGMKTEDS